VVAAAITAGLLWWYVPPSASLPSCSDRGIYFTDIGACGCYECWSGSNCENLVGPLENCTLDMGLGNPIYQELDWKSKNLKVITDYGYRASYIVGISAAIPPSTTTGFLGNINQKLRTLHRSYNNYNPNDTYLILGAGGLPLIQSAIYAYVNLIGSPIYLFAKVPYYPRFAQACTYLPSWCTFISDLNGTDISKVVEIVTYPNNPDADLSTPISGSQYLIYDFVYHWPMSMPDDIPVQPFQYPLAIFSMSKFSGHASSRFGWAWVKNKTFADRMGSMNAGVSSDGIARSMKIVDYALENKEEFVNSLRGGLMDRWERVLEIMKDIQGLTIASGTNSYYLFLKCEYFVGDDCSLYFNRYGIKTWNSAMFGLPADTPGYVRINIGGAPDVTFELFLERLEKMRDSLTNEAWTR